ncbi:MAG: ABC transporter ATP-binding protein, partial [Bacteroidaceae bacterium]
MRSKDVLKDAIREFDGTVIVVSHDREFLDGLVTKVYEFSGGKVKEHLGGIYDFLQRKQMASLNELQTKRGLSASPVISSTTSAAEETEAPKENKLSYEAQKEQSKKIRKAEKLVVDCEKRIEQLEADIAVLEERMASPEESSSTDLYERHQQLKKELDHTVEEWETVSMELEELN